MASIKVKFRPSTVADHEGTIYYQIIHERKVRQLLSDYKVFPSEWDGSRSMVVTTQRSERKAFILSIREHIRWDVERLNKIDKKLDANGLSYTADPGNRQLAAMQDISGDKPVLSRHNPLADTTTVYRPAGIWFKAIQRESLYPPA